MRKEFIPGMMLGIILILRVYTGFALDPRKSMDFYRHNIWTVEDGLPMNSVISITQTPDGYIWLGTETGLARFDGIDFDVFSHENTPALLNDLILSLEADLQGVLWIGTRGGGITRCQNGTFNTFTTDNGLLDNEIWTILETSDNAIWIGTRNGLNCFFEGKLAAVHLPEKLSNYNVRALTSDRLGRVWVGTRGAGLLLVEKRGNRFESEFKGLAGLNITALLEDRGGNIWIGTSDAGLIRLQENQPFFYNTKNGLSSNYVGCLLEDRAGNLWIGTHGGGICLLKNGKNHFSIFDNRNGLSSNAINTLYEDREGTLWIGTNGGGLNCLGDTRITTYTMKNGLSYDIITTIFQDSRGNTWIGSMGSGIDYLNAKNDRFQSITTRDGLSTNMVYSISEHPGGCLWFGTLGGGVNRLTLKNNQIDVFTTREGLSDNFVRALYTDPSGILWAGTDNGGVHRFSNGWFILYDNVQFRVNTLFKDNKGGLWAGTWGRGLCLLKDGKTRVFNKEHGLSDNIVMSIYEDNEGILWIGTYSGGLNRFHDEKFTCISKKNGLPDNTIYCILEDQKQYLWMSSNHGIFYVKREELDDLAGGKIKRLSPCLFTTEDGMKSIECNGGNQPAGWKTRDEKLWFPTTKGASVIDPENIGINTFPPPVQIKKVVINGTSYDVGKKAVVPPGKGSLEIYYTGISFVMPKKILFKYKIEGLEEHWTDAGTRRTVKYIGIPPGSYRFRVIACNSDGTWNNTGAFFDFYLKCKYYQTLIFKISFPIGIILIISFFYYSAKKYLLYRKLKRKYKGSCLDPKEASQYMEQILHLIEVEKVYKDPDISLNSLARKLGTSPRNLSQIINEHLGKNFYELINQYRISEAQKILASSRSGEMSILEIGYEVGFNSKSAFNRAFRHFTHLTPTQYKNRNGSQPTV
jgi:ligand-binding sensor domain-containing protein/AraC-like DNA-binding protein